MLGWGHFQDRIIASAARRLRLTHMSIGIRRGEGTRGSKKTDRPTSHTIKPNKRAYPVYQNMLHCGMAVNVRSESHWEVMRYRMLHKSKAADLP